MEESFAPSCQAVVFGNVASDLEEAPYGVAENLVFGGQGLLVVSLSDGRWRKFIIGQRSHGKQERSGQCLSGSQLL